MWLGAFGLLFPEGVFEKAAALLVPVPLRELQRRLAVAGGTAGAAEAGSGIRAALQQQGDELAVAVEGGGVEGRESVRAGGVYVGAVLQQQPQAALVVLEGGEVQGGETLVVELRCFPIQIAQQQEALALFRRDELGHAHA